MWLPLVWTWAKHSIQTKNYLQLEFAIVRAEKNGSPFYLHVSNGIPCISRTVMSGTLCGMTGSYIFSQTIFTYRTGVHSKWIGFFIMLVFLYVVTSPVNVLQMAPLFFFGATLIFIGYDLLYEWVSREVTDLPLACIFAYFLLNPLQLIEIRHKVFLSEYCIVWATFIAIQVVGIDFGIVLGVLVAIVSHVVSTAQISSVNRVLISSRAV